MGLTGDSVTALVVIAAGVAVVAAVAAVVVVGGASVLGKNTVAADVSLHLSIGECISHEERRSTKKTRKARAKRNVRTVFFFTIATSSVM